MFADREKILATMANFTWFFSEDWFVVTDFGNFHWRDPRYGGNNAFTLFNGGYDLFRQNVGVVQGRDKGQHEIERYCGRDIVLVYPGD